jgi:hypothetical protein
MGVRKAVGEKVKQGIAKAEAFVKKHALVMQLGDHREIIAALATFIFEERMEERATVLAEARLGPRPLTYAHVVLRKGESARVIGCFRKPGLANECVKDDRDARKALGLPEAEYEYSVHCLEET